MNVLWQGCRDRYLFFRGGKMAGMAERSLVPWQRSGRLCLDTDTLLDLWHWWVVLYDDTDGVWMPTGRYCRRCDAKRAMECYAAGTPLFTDEGDAAAGAAAAGTAAHEDDDEVGFV